jgi:hypothetical protein
MLSVDFTNDDTCRLHEQLVYAYERQEEVESLLVSAGIPVGDYPSRDTQRESWKAFLVQLEKSNRVDKLLQAVLQDPKSEKIHDDVRAFIDGPSRANGASTSSMSIDDAEAPTFLLCKTLHRHLGEEAEAISNKLVDRIARNNRISGVELFEATRFAIEYQLLTAEDLTPTLILDLAHGRLEQHLEEFRTLLVSGLANKNMRRIKVKVDGHCFFSRIVEREADWQVYFETLRLLGDGAQDAGSTLCRIRTDGFVAPQFLVAGLLPRFEDDWHPIITEYEQQVGRDQSAFLSFQTSQWTTWLMWGPSIPICQCREWEGIRAFQYGYGDENNSVPIIGVANGVPTSFENIPGGYAPRERSVGATFSEMKGRLRWAPWLLRKTNQTESPPVTSPGELPVPAPRTFLAARAQRFAYEKAQRGNQRGALLFQAEGPQERDGDAAPQSYFSAYLWLMFLVARKPAEPQLPLQRLSGEFPPLTVKARARKESHLWRELLPVYVHANIADANALLMHRRTLVNNAVSLLREIWTEQPTLFPKLKREELCFCLVGGSDYSGCGHQIRFSSDDCLIARLRTRMADEPNREFASSVLLPAPEETMATRPGELAQFYSTCHLPDLVADYYAYIAEPKGD